LVTVIALTTADITIFRRYSGVIWQTWGHIPPAAFDLLALLAIWIGSAAVMWFHVSNDLLQVLRRRQRFTSQNLGAAAADPRRDSDV
jgi:uncharacterized integral membrane protein